MREGRVWLGEQRTDLASDGLGSGALRRKAEQRGAGAVERRAVVCMGSDGLGLDRCGMERQGRRWSAKVRLG